MKNNGSPSPVFETDAEYSSFLVRLPVFQEMSITKQIVVGKNIIYGGIPQPKCTPNHPKNAIFKNGHKNRQILVVNKPKK